LADIESDAADVLKTILASNKAVVAEDLEDFDNKTIAEL
jgi:hypothetical protein